VDYVLKRPTPEPYNSITVGDYGGDQGYVHGDFGGPLADGKFGYRINLVEQPRGDTAVSDQSLQRDLFSAAFDWHVTDKLLFQVETSHSDYHLDGQDAVIGLATAVGRMPSAPDADKLHTPPYTYRDLTTDKGEANIKWDISDLFTVRTAYRYQDSQTDYLYSYAVRQPNGTYSQSLSKFAPYDMIEQGGYFFLDSHFDTAFIKHTLTAGFSGNFYEQRQYKDNFSSFTFNGLSLDALSDTPQPAWSAIGTKAMYTSSRTGYTNWSIGDDIKITDQWSALAGVNYAEIQSSNYNTSLVKTADYDKSAATPSVSLIYKPIPWISTYATYMEALQQGAIVGPGYTNTGSILDPLISKQYEIGAKATVGGILLTAALFQIDEANQYSNNALPLPTYVQDGREVHKGMEFTATGKVTDRLTLWGGFTLFDATVERTSTPYVEGKKPTGTPEQYAKLYAEYNLPWIKGLTLQGGIYYTGTQYVDTLNTDELPPFVTEDVGARYETKIEGYPTIFRLYVTNVTNKSYWQDWRQVGDPRSIALSMQVKF
jgi:iron complex outermembrane receptor protein